MLDGSSIAAIVTGILALLGAIATAWMSGWNEQRIQSRANKKSLARYSVPLLIASWDLANWFYDILEESNYSPQRCKAYGDGWNSQFTSYLLGQYFAGVHIVRELTHFFSHMRGVRVDELKKLLWKIQDEFISMHYEGRESLEMRWFEGDILAAQEKMTVAADLDGDGKEVELRTLGWVEFQQNYGSKGEGDNEKSMEFKKLFGWYEEEFQRIVYRRFKYLYSTRWKGQDNPQDLERLQATVTNEELLQAAIKEENLVKKELQADPKAGLVIPDHRVRRLQHLLSDLVELLDEVSGMKLNRPIRRCKMSIGDGGDRVPCDCHFGECNPRREDFYHRQLTISSKGAGPLGKLTRPRRQLSSQLDDFERRRKTTEKENDSQC